MNMEILDEGFINKSPIEELRLKRLRLKAKRLSKDIRNGKVVLIILALLTIPLGVFAIFTAVGIFESALIVCGFSLFYLYGIFTMNKNPLVAMSVGSGGFVLNQLYSIFITGSPVYTGIFLKIIVIYFLVKGIYSANELEKIRHEFMVKGEQLGISV